MTLSIRNTLRSLSMLALIAAFLPGCDGEESEALGLSSEELDAMSEEELDELAALEDDADLEHSVDRPYQDLAAPLHPADPDPAGRPDDLTAPAATADASESGFAGPNALWAPTHTHTGAQSGVATDTLLAPWHTHTEIPGVVDGIAEPDPGCKPHTVYTQLSNN